ncbi:outer membrane lipoprotein carrier protein LolA [Acidobacteria bacterium AB60]|nr:outer membrane lipoprotein carrier protein LolA [Acidobacteria bacterium AB60]
MRVQIRMAAALVLGLMLAPSSFAADDVKSVLTQLNAAAAKFRSASATLEQVNEMTEPIPDKDVMQGSIYTEHKGSAVALGIHIDKENGKPAPRIITIKNGVFSMYEKLTNQVTVSKQAGKYESYLSLGFGGSGTALEANWNITYGGSETLNGVKVAKLDLVPKDPAVLKLFRKVTIWIDPERGVSLKQYFDQGQGQSRMVTYSNIKVNQSLPGDAFSFKTDSKTQVINR